MVFKDKPNGRPYRSRKDTKWRMEPNALAVSVTAIRHVLDGQACFMIGMTKICQNNRVYFSASYYGEEICINSSLCKNLLKACYLMLIVGYLP